MGCQIMCLCAFDGDLEGHINYYPFRISQRLDCLISGHDDATPPVLSEYKCPFGTQTIPGSGPLVSCFFFKATVNRIHGGLSISDCLLRLPPVWGVGSVRWFVPRVQWNLKTAAN